MTAYRVNVVIGIALIYKCYYHVLYWDKEGSSEKSLLNFEVVFGDGSHLVQSPISTARVAKLADSVVHLYLPL